MDGKEDTLLRVGCQLFLEDGFSATITSSQPSAFRNQYSSFAICHPSSLILHEVPLVSLAYDIHRETQR